MRELIALMAAPFAACLVLVGIHAYLGLHVIQRKVIFVDLALAQIAALGATFGFLLGVSPHGDTGYLFSLGFAIVGAGIFALSRMRHERIPQEAIIGIVYAVALAMAILVADRAPEGSEHIKESLTGALLWVRWPTILKTGIIYALVGLLHVVLRKRFFQISFEPEQAYAEGRSVRFWDFIFYVTFAFVITSSVAIAGVLVVFSFLVIPAVIATLFAERISTRLVIGWSVGIVACAVGLAGSYRLDMPSGPSVVAALGGALIMSALVYSIWRAESRASALFKVGAWLGVLALAVIGLGVFFTSGAFLHVVHEHEWEAEETEEASGVTEVADTWQTLATDCDGDPGCIAADLQKMESWPERLGQRLAEASASERELWIGVLGEVQGPEAASVLVGLASGEPDPLLRQRAVEILIGRGDRQGLSLAVDLLEDDTVPPLVRDDVYALLSAEAERDFGFDPFASRAENAAAILSIRSWLEGAPASQ